MGKIQVKLGRIVGSCRLGSLKIGEVFKFTETDPDLTNDVGIKISCEANGDRCFCFNLSKCSTHDRRGNALVIPLKATLYVEEEK